MTVLQKRALLTAACPGNQKWADRVRFMPIAQVNVILRELQSQGLAKAA